MWRVPTPLQETENMPEMPRNSLLDGEFDEDANRKSFQQALQQWRTGSTEELATQNKLSLKENQQIISITESLLDGEYNEEANRVAFQEALHQWRSGPRLNTPQKEEGQQTATLLKSKIHVEFESGLSYLDKLTLQTKMQPLEYVPIPKQCIDEIDSKESEEEWDEEDEILFKDLIEKRSSKRESAPENVRYQKNDLEWDQEEISMFLELLELREAKHSDMCLTMEDITAFEDDYILETLQAGRMVECIPSSKLKIIEIE
jgi:hypothetical protein